MSGMTGPIPTRGEELNHLIVHDGDGEPDVTIVDLDQDGAPDAT